MAPCGRVRKQLRYHVSLQRSLAANKLHERGRRAAIVDLTGVVEAVDVAIDLVSQLQQLVLNHGIFGWLWQIVFDDRSCAILRYGDGATGRGQVFLIAFRRRYVDCIVDMVGASAPVSR